MPTVLLFTTEHADVVKQINQDSTASSLGIFNSLHNNLHTSVNTNNTQYPSKTTHPTVEEKEHTPKLVANEDMRTITSG
jgi:hypothetical protein